MTNKRRTRRTRSSIFWLLLPLLSFLVLVYPFARLVRWYAGPDLIIWPVALVVWLLAVFALIGSFNWRWRLPQFILLHWLGIGFIFFSLVIIYEVIRLFVSFDDHNAAIIITVLAILACIIAFIVAQRLIVKELRFNSAKINAPVRLVQISDVHIGSRRKEYLQRIVKRINDLDPDHVVITGDLLDTSRVGRDDLAALADLNGSVYGITGNHERYVGLDRVLPMLAELGVQMLHNDHVILEDVQLIGIDDAEHHEQVAQQLPTIKQHQDKYRILLYHRPAGWQEAIDHGIDLMLSGHTHNGQIIPFNFLVKQEFKLIKGLYQQDRSHLYVSTGTGTWGPILRLGSVNEITCIDLVPE